VGYGPDVISKICGNRGGVGVGRDKMSYHAEHSTPSKEKSAVRNDRVGGGFLNGPVNRGRSGDGGGVPSMLQTAPCRCGEKKTGQKRKKEDQKKKKLGRTFKGST